MSVKNRYLSHTHTHTQKHHYIGNLIIPAQEIHFSLALRIKQELCINRCVVIICAPLHLGNRKMRFQSPLHLQHLPMLNEKKDKCQFMRSKIELQVVDVLVQVLVNVKLKLAAMFLSLHHSAIQVTAKTKRLKTW